MTTDLQGNYFGSIFSVFIISTYTIFTAPFIFYALTPYEVRIGLELVVIFSIFVFMSSRTISIAALQHILIWLTFVMLELLTTQISYEVMICSSVLWVYFLLFIPEANKSNRLCNLIEKGWFWIWLYISITVVVGFVCNIFNIVTFDILDFGEITTATYTYNYNLFFGNVINIIYFGNSVPRMSWYVFEPGLLAFFLGLNVIIARTVFVSYKYKTLFMRLNFVAGCFTFSTTFILFFLVWIIYRFMGRILSAKTIWASLGILLVTIICFAYIIFENDLLVDTSIADRLLRFNIAWDIAKNNSLLTFLFGNGIGVSSIVADRGISSGIINIFIERGLLILIFLSYIIYKYAQPNKMLMIYIAFCSLAVEIVWSPAFLIVLFLEYAARRRGYGSADVVKAIREKVSNGI